MFHDPSRKTAFRVVGQVGRVVLAAHLSRVPMPLQLLRLPFRAGLHESLAAALRGGAPAGDASPPAPATPGPRTAGPRVALVEWCGQCLPDRPRCTATCRFFVEGAHSSTVEHFHADTLALRQR